MSRAARRRRGGSRPGSDRRHGREFPPPRDYGDPDWRDRFEFEYAFGVEELHRILLDRRRPPAARWYPWSVHCWPWPRCRRPPAATWYFWSGTAGPGRAGAHRRRRGTRSGTAGHNRGAGAHRRRRGARGRAVLALAGLLLAGAGSPYTRPRAVRGELGAVLVQVHQAFSADAPVPQVSGTWSSSWSRVALVSIGGFGCPPGLVTRHRRGWGCRLRRLASNRAPSRLIPGLPIHPGSDVFYAFFDASDSIHLPRPHLTQSRHAFSLNAHHPGIFTTHAATRTAILKGQTFISHTAPLQGVTTYSPKHEQPLSTFMAQIGGKLAAGEARQRRAGRERGSRTPGTELPR